MKDQGFKDRMSGMLYAYNIAKKEGIEGLEKEIKKRNITKLPMHITKSEADRLWNELCANMYNNITATFLYCLHDRFGWDEKQISEICDEYQKQINNVLDVDFMGEHYVKLEDYAQELVTNCGIDLDLNRIAVCQDYYDENNKDSRYHYIKLERLIQEFEDNNLLAAAQFLRKKVEQ